ncbi:YARHG domain-containing protein [Blautia producta]|nr:YARHG domain-containing protein [Blautia producta]NSG15803.1 YARHG domain-containing protein [Blautia producta]NSJ75998.1 YARHG domain-containing protein [Blautia producta]
MQPQSNQKRKPPVSEKRPPKSNGKGLLIGAFACSVWMVLLFLLLRFVFADAATRAFGADGIYSYVIYVLPLTLGVIGLLLGIFAVWDRTIRTASIVAILVSVLGMSGIVGAMIFLPYEPEISSGAEEDEPKEDASAPQDSKEKKGEEVSEEATALNEVMKQYKAGNLDYIQAKEALDEINEEALEGEEAEKLLNFQDELEMDLKVQMSHLAEISDYKTIMENLRNMETAVQGSDEVLTDLRETYEPEYILYLDTESRKLAEAGQSKEAVSMLEEAKPLVDDSQAVTALILDIQSGVTGGDYILPDSNSRYLTESDIQYLSIREINYAKNEIYARHGRRFQSQELQNYFNSKSWYRGTIEPSDFQQSVLNDYEKKNAELLSKREFSMESGGYKLDVN